MAEKLTLDTPRSYNPAPGLSAAVPDLLPFDIHLRLNCVPDPVTGEPGYVDAGSIVEVMAMGKHGLVVHETVAAEAAAATLIRALNKANLGTKSLLQRVLEQLAAKQRQTGTDEQGDPVFDAPFSGTIGGTPE